LGGRDVEDAVAHKKGLWKTRLGSSWGRVPRLELLG
jgi:hypothetical protein